MANGMRQILLLLLPAAAAIFVLSEPITRLVYQRGVFDASQTDLVSTALFWFAFSLPFNGLNLLLNRTFFSLQRPWLPTGTAAANLAITAGAAAAFYKPFGVGGIVAATALATAVNVVVQCIVLRPVLGGIEGTRLVWSALRIAAASALLAGVSYLVWEVLDGALGRGLGGQIVSVGAALAAGGLAYAAAVTALRIPEAHQIRRLLLRRA
jgi:putative peptidoglycan lipid II flippase